MDMTKRTGAALTPHTMQEVAETVFSKDGNNMTEQRTEQHARQLFEQLVAPLRKAKDKQADERAREWTVGALTAAFPRARRADVRPKMRELVERATGAAPNNRAFKVGDVVVIERFFGHACGPKDKALETRKQRIVRETPTRWVLSSFVGGSAGNWWIDKRTNIVRPAYMNYIDRARLP